jgi:hypothetical protein
MANSTMATVSDYKLMLEDMKSVKSVELPFVKGMKDLDFASYDNLEKVTGNSLSDQRNILTINPKYDMISTWYFTSNCSVQNSKHSFPCKKLMYIL